MAKATGDLSLVQITVHIRNKILQTNCVSLLQTNWQPPCAIWGLFFCSTLSCIFKWAVFELGGCCHCRSALIQTTNLICWLCACSCNLNLSLPTRMNLLSSYLHFCIIIWVSWLICNDTDLEGMENIQQHKHKFGIQMSVNYLLWKKREETTKKKNGEWWSCFDNFSLLRELEQWRGRQTTIKEKRMEKKWVSVPVLTNSWTAMSLCPWIYLIFLFLLVSSGKFDQQKRHEPSVEGNWVWDGCLNCWPCLWENPGCAWEGHLISVLNGVFPSLLA